MKTYVIILICLFLIVDFLVIWKLYRSAKYLSRRAAYYKSKYNYACVDNASLSSNWEKYGEKGLQMAIASFCFKYGKNTFLEVDTPNMVMLPKMIVFDSPISLDLSIKRGVLIKGICLCHVFDEKDGLYVRVLDSVVDNIMAVTDDNKLLSIILFDESSLFKIVRAMEKLSVQLDTEDVEQVGLSQAS